MHYIENNIHKNTEEKYEVNYLELTSAILIIFFLPQVGLRELQEVYILGNLIATGYLRSRKKARNNSADSAANNPESNCI